MTDIAQIFPSPPPPLSIEPDLKVAFVLSPCFTLVAFAGFIDCLRHAADVADFSRQIHCKWTVIAPDANPILASCGVPVTPDSLFTEMDDVNYVVVVGGQLPWSMEVPEKTLDFLRAVHAKGTKIIGLCTGSFILARAGLLNNKRCAVHAEHRTQFRRLFPKAHAESDRISIDDGGIITCPGGTSAIDLAYTLIEMHCGKARAIKGLTALLVDRHRTAHHTPRQPFGDLTSCGNWRVEQAVRLMQRNFSNPYSIAALAEQLNTSERELNRDFNNIAQESPSTIYRNMRLAHGHWLLENSTRTITQIAFECGFSDGAHFSRWFKHVYGESPRRFRLSLRTA